MVRERSTPMIVRIAVLIAFVAGADAAVAKTRGHGEPDATILMWSKPGASRLTEGALRFHGRRYPLTIEGLSAGGAVGADASGKIYHLKLASDFPGIYVTSNEGPREYLLTLTNRNGVLLRLGRTSRGLKLTPAPEGVKIQLRDAAGRPARGF